jgi:hypothetical protein
MQSYSPKKLLLIPDSYINLTECISKEWQKNTHLWEINFHLCANNLHIFILGNS